MTVVAIVLTLAAILGAAVLFVNAVEIIGELLNLSSGAVGSVLAAVGTAMPEVVIPVVAILTAFLAGEGAAGASSGVGIGAILGAPFLLTTLGMFVVGSAALGYRKRRESGAEISADETVMRRDVGFFLPAFFLAAAAGVVPVPGWVKIVLGFALIGAYVFYVLRTIKGGDDEEGGDEEESPEDLTLWPSSRGTAPTWAVVAQLVGALAVMVAGARFFVMAVEQGSAAIGVSAGVIALVLSPLGTELAEKFNSVLWIRDDKDTLGMGNMAGAMVFQSTVPVSLGLFFTSWRLDFLTALSAGLALVSGSVLYLALRSKRPLRASLLMCGLIPYVAFLVAVVVTVT